MQVTIVTSQNVPIDYEVAGIGARIGAWVIDILIEIGYVIGMVLIFSQLIPALGSNMIAVMIVILPPFLYDLVCEIFMNGQTLGKRQLDIRVVRLDGSQPTIGSYLLRWLLRPIDITMMGGVVAILTILLNGKGQRLGDIAAGTTVVSTKTRVTLDDTILATTEEGYVPVYPEVTKLTDRDMSIIKDVLDISRRDRNTETLKALATKVRSVLDVDSGAMSPLQFLQTVLKDYNHITGE